MIIRTALTGDNHFNVPRRSEEARRVLYAMLEDWKVRQVHLIGFAGDLADGPMTERDRAWLIEYISHCTEVAPVFVVAGNHDIELSIRNAIAKLPRVTVEDGGDVHVIETVAGPIAVAGLSFPHKAKLLAHVGPVSNEEADHIAGEALQDVCRGLGIKVARFGLPTVALVHGTIRGSKIAPDQPDRPLGLDISLSTLDLIGADFTVCGHIHLQQLFTFNGRDYVVPGSPFFSDFGESKYEKGYVVAEFETDGYYGGPQMLTGGEPRTVHEVKWFRVPTPATPMLLVEAVWDGTKLVFRG